MLEALDAEGVLQFPPIDASGDVSTITLLRVGPSRVYLVPHTAPDTSVTLSVESPDGMLMLSGLQAPHINANSYWDGTDWQRFDVAQAASNLIVQAGGLLYRTAAPAANPIANWVTAFNVDGVGNVTIPGSATITGNASVTGTVTAATVTSNGWLYANGNHLWFGTSVWMRWGGSPGRIDFSHGLAVPDLLCSGALYAHGGSIYFEASNAVRLYYDGWLHSTWGFLSDGVIQSSSDIRATGRMYCGNWDVGTTLSVGGTIRSASSYTCDSGDVVLSAGSVRINQAGAVVGYYGGGGISYGGNIGRPQDWLYLWMSTYTYWDMDCGHDIHCSALYQSSRGEAKLGQAPMTDAEALARVLNPVPQIVTWDSTPEPQWGGQYGYAPGYGTQMLPAPTKSAQRHVGFLAEEIVGVVPEVVSTDDIGPSGISYANLTALLWGALREYVAQTEARFAALEGAR